MSVEIRPHYTVWYTVMVFGIKTCFKMQVEAYDRREAIEFAKKRVKEKTKHDVIDCTVVNPFAMNTRAWKNEIVADRTNQELPPHKY